MLTLAKVIFNTAMIILGILGIGAPIFGLQEYQILLIAMPVGAAMGTASMELYEIWLDRKRDKEIKELNGTRL